MQPALFYGDVLTIDTEGIPKDRDLIVCIFNNMLLCKEYRIINELIYLDSENIDYIPLLISENDSFEVIGIVTNITRYPNKHYEAIDKYNFIKSLNLNLSNNPESALKLTRESLLGGRK
jgi:hypothetical protein